MAPVRTPACLLPPDDAQREALHNEVHARPPALLRLPALIVFVAVLNEGVTREHEWQHLRRLPGQQHLELAQLEASFLRLHWEQGYVKWERHSEYTRYSIVQPLPEQALLGASVPELLPALATERAWLQQIPGRTVAAIEMGLVHGDMANPQEVMAQAQAWFGERPVGSLVSGGHSAALADFVLRPDGIERMLIVAPTGITETRAGRIAQRMLEVETYRLMALRGLPVAKALAPVLDESEKALADITARLESIAASDQQLLDQLVALAGRIERATAEHGYRFSATRAYHALVQQRITELREREIAGTQMIGEFMQRRLSPAMATVAATAQRLESLAERIGRASALLRTRVDIATEAQNRQLLEKLTRGQELQLKLQTTVEGLSIAAISYYVISLLLYGAKALKTVGVPINPELAIGLLIPIVLWAVARATKRVHQKLHSHR